MEKKSKGGKGIDDNPSLSEFKERRKGYAEPKPVTPAEAQWLGISKSPKNIQDRYKIERIYTKTEKGKKETIFDISISFGTGSAKMESHVIPFEGNEYLYFSVEDNKKIPFMRDNKQKSNSQVVDRVATTKIKEEKKNTVVVKADQTEKNIEAKLDEKKLTAIDQAMRAGKLSYRDDTTSPAKDVFLGEKDVLVAGKEKGQRYILVIEVFVEYQKTGDGSIKPLTRTVRGWINKNNINKEIEKREKVGVAGAFSATPGPKSPESNETIFNREYAFAISAYNAGKEMLYTATGKDAETVVATHYINWLKVKYMQATKKIAPVAFTKEDLEAVVKNVQAIAPVVEVKKLEPTPIVSPYVEPVKPEPKKEEPVAVLSTENKTEMTEEDRKNKEKEIFEKIKEEIGLNHYEKDLFENGYPIENMIINQISFYIEAIEDFDENKAEAGSVRVYNERVQNLKKLNDFLIELNVKPKMVASKDSTAQINAKEELDLKDIAPDYEFILKEAKEGNIQFVLAKGPRTLYYKQRGSSAVSYYVSGKEYGLESGFQARFSRQIDEKYNTEVWNPVKLSTELPEGIELIEKEEKKKDGQPIFTAEDIVLRNEKAQIERKRQEDLDYWSADIRSEFNQALKDPNTSEDEKKNIREHLANIEKFLNDFYLKIEKHLEENPDSTEAKELLAQFKKKLENIDRINKKYDKQLLELEKEPKEEESIFDPLVIEKLNEAIRKRGISGMRHGSEFIDLLASKLEYPDLDEELSDILEKAKKK